MARWIQQSTLLGARRRGATLPAVALSCALAASVVVPAAAATAAGTATLAVPATGGSAAGVSLTNGSLYNVVDQVGARALWARGFTGRGVNVAIIDTGIAPVAALSGPGKVVAAVDLTAEASDPSSAFIDTYGHGTHMAGIIAGEDPGADPATAALHPDWFLGVAPDAGIVSVKVGDRTGAVDVTQVIAGVDWVTDHAATLNIRVLNLSFDSGSTLPYSTDPLDAAIERAWKAGIVVVAPAGNDGRATRHLGTPANDPYVIAVAAAELKNNDKKWKVPNWVTTGDGVRNPDLSAPGTSIVSLRDPGSTVDQMHPEGFASVNLFKGTGSSQAAAVISGTAALLLSARPSLTPDQVKQVLIDSADGKAITPKAAAKSGSGLVQLTSALTTPVSAAVQAWPLSSGAGSLDAARGGVFVTVNDQVVQGNVTVFGTPWDGYHWTGFHWTNDVWSGFHWTDGSWMGYHWTGFHWTGFHWTDATWSSLAWDGYHWTNAGWV